MPITTPNLGLALPAQNSSAWNVPLNANMTLLDTYLGNRPRELTGSYLGQPLGGVTIYQKVFASSAALPINFGGSVAFAGANPTATATCSITKNGTAIGSMTFATSGVATFTSSGVPISFAVGDVIRIIAPLTQDASLMDLSFTLLCQ